MITVKTASKGVICPDGKFVTFHPKEDITTLELAYCLEVIQNGSISDSWDKIVSYGIERHWE